MVTIDECIEFVLKNIGLWWRYGISRHCGEWKYIIGRIFESEIILISPSLKIFESSSNGNYRNTDDVWWRYGISRSCDECVRGYLQGSENGRVVTIDIRHLVYKMCAPNVNSYIRVCFTCPVFRYISIRYLFLPVVDI